MSCSNLHFRDSPSAIPEELQFFNLPQFSIDKMKDFMIQKKQEELQRIADAAKAKMEADLHAKLGKPTYKYHASLLIV